MQKSMSKTERWSGKSLNSVLMNKKGFLLSSAKCLVCVSPQRAVYVLEVII